MRITTTIKGSRVGQYDIRRGVNHVAELVSAAVENDYPTDIMVELSGQFKAKNRSNQDVFSAKVTVVE